MWNVTRVTFSVECYDVKKKEWFPCSDMLTMRGSHGIAIMNGKIYAVGKWIQHLYSLSLLYITSYTSCRR